MKKTSYKKGVCMVPVEEQIKIIRQWKLLFLGGMSMNAAAKKLKIDGMTLRSWEKALSERGIYTFDAKTET